MKTILLTLILIFPLFLSAKWEKIESPKSIQNLSNIKSGTDFLVGCNYDIFFSFDEGETWEKRVNGLPKDRVSTSLKTVYENFVLALVLNSYTSYLRTIYYTQDKGLNWQNLTNNLDSNITFTEVKIDNTNIYILPLRKSFILKTSDFGETWDSSITWQNIKITPTFFDVENDSIVLIENSSINAGGGEAIVSTDGGISWENRSDKLFLSGVSLVRLEKQNIYIGDKSGLFYSTDFGDTWQSPTSPIVNNLNIRQLEIYNDTVFLGTNRGIYKAKDLAKGWEQITYFENKRIFDLHAAFDKLYVKISDQDYSNNLNVVSAKNNYNIFSRLNYFDDSYLNDFIIDYPKIYCSSENIEYLENLNSNFNRLYQSNSSNGLTGLSKFKNYFVSTFLKSSYGSIINKTIYSTDNGSNWEFKNINSENETISIRDLLFLDSDSLLILSHDNGVYISNNLQFELNRIYTGNDTINNLLQKIERIFRIDNSIFYVGEGIILESDTNLRNWVNYSDNFYNYLEILNISKNKNNIYVITHSGGFVDVNTLNVLKSNDNGKSWTFIKEKFKSYVNFWPQNIFVIDNYVFLSSQNGLFLSRDVGESWEEINEGVNADTRFSGGEFYLYGDKILFCSAKGIYHRDLSDLGIYLSVERTEDRNYLWTNPPYPQPSNNQVKVEVYWDSGLPFTSDDVEIYDLTGVKININGQINVKKENNWKGNIIWDASNQNPGIYIMKITHGTETRTRKILITE